MDIEFEANKQRFVWDMDKASDSLAKHNIEFTEAATVFADPQFVLIDTARNGESRHKAIGFSSAARLLAVVHTEVNDETLRIISAWQATAAEITLYCQSP